MRMRDAEEEEHYWTDYQRRVLGRYQGIGVRIEDEVLITPTGHEVCCISVIVLLTF